MGQFHEMHSTESHLQIVEAGSLLLQLCLGCLSRLRSLLQISICCLQRASLILQCPAAPFKALLLAAHVMIQDRKSCNMPRHDSHDSLPRSTSRCTDHSKDAAPCHLIRLQGEACSVMRSAHLQEGCTSSSLTRAESCCFSAPSSSSSSSSSSAYASVSAASVSS